jgi:hypothetical protein
MTRPRDIADSINRINSSAADATAVTIDSSEQVGIGTATPNSYYSKELVVAHGTEGGITLVGAAGTATGYLMFADGTTGNEAYRGYVGYSHSTPDVMVFGTSGAERMRILSGGGLTFNGDTATANALDDYEEGTWTPSYSITGASFNMSLQLGYYVKVGRMVTASARVRGQRSGGSGELTLTGLPFTTNTTANLQPAASIGFTNGWSASPKGAFAGANSTIIGFKKSGSTSALSNIADDITHSDVSTSSTSSNDLILSITYMTS